MAWPIVREVDRRTVSRKGEEGCVHFEDLSTFSEALREETRVVSLKVGFDRFSVSTTVDIDFFDAAIG